MEEELWRLVKPRVTYEDDETITLHNKADDFVLEDQGCHYMVMSFFLARILLLPSSYHKCKHISNGVFGKFKKKMSGTGSDSHLMMETFTERVMGMMFDAKFIIQDETHPFELGAKDERGRVYVSEDPEYGSVVGINFFLRKELTVKDFKTNLKKIGLEVCQELSKVDQTLRHHGGSLTKMSQAAGKAETRLVHKLVNKMDAVTLETKGPEEVQEVKATSLRVGWSREEFVDKDPEDIAFVLYMRLSGGVQAAKDIYLQRMADNGIDTTKILQREKEWGESQTIKN